MLAFNDGVFTEEDFRSIQNIGNSIKKDATDKTGRFGIGEAPTFSFIAREHGLLA